MADRKAGHSRDATRRIVKDMSLSHVDFFRTVRPLLEGEDHEVRDDGVTIRRDAATIDIRLGPEGARKLGNFRLPRTVVEICFQHCTPEDVTGFVARFDRHFRRGGG